MRMLINVITTSRFGLVRQSWFKSPTPPRCSSLVTSMTVRKVWSAAKDRAAASVVVESVLLFPRSFG